MNKGTNSHLEKLQNISDAKGFDLSDHFDDVFNAIPDLVFYKDRYLKIKGANKSFLKFLGVDTQEEIVGKDIPAIFNAVDALLLEEGDMQVIGTSETLNQSVAIEDKNNAVKWFHIKKSPILCKVEGCIGLLVIMSDVTLVKKVQESQQELIEELQETNTELQKVKGQLLNAQENQRKKISSELHDDLGQHLTAIKYSLQNNNIDPAIIQMVDDGINKIRLLSRNISPLYLKNNNLRNLIELHVQKVNAAQKIDFGLDYKLEQDEIDPVSKLHLFRIVQEVSNNIIKHSGGTSCVIKLYSERNQMVLEILDNGDSYNFFEELQKATSFGLLTINERIKTLKGSIIYFAKDENDPYNILKVVV